MKSVSILLSLAACFSANSNDCNWLFAVLKEDAKRIIPIANRYSNDPLVARIAMAISEIKDLNITQPFLLSLEPRLNGDILDIEVIAIGASKSAFLLKGLYPQKGLGTRLAKLSAGIIKAANDIRNKPESRIKLIRVYSNSIKNSELAETLKRLGFSRPKKPSLRDVVEVLLTFGDLLELRIPLRS
jgi:hypothetical protein